MKPIFAAFMVTLASAMVGWGQTYSPIIVIPSCTVTNNTALSNSLMAAQGAIISCGKQDSVTVSVSYDLSAAGKTTNYLWLVPSVDRTGFDSRLTKIIELGDADNHAPGPTGRVTMLTNISTYGVGFFKIAQTTNHTTATINFTNYVVTYGYRSD